jgi:hypothetical protein
MRALEAACIFQTVRKGGLALALLKTIRNIGQYRHLYQLVHKLFVIQSHNKYSTVLYEELLVID